MSKSTLILNTGQQAIIERDLNKIFTWENRYEKFDYTNGSYDDVTILAGTVMGRVHATGKIKPLESDAVDGSQIPIGILAENVTIEAGDTQELAVCVYGDVARDKVIFDNGTDTLATVVDSRRLDDRIAGDTVGIRLVSSREHTKSDNQ